MANAFKISWSNKFDSVNERCRTKNASHANTEELKLIRRANMMVSSIKMCKTSIKKSQVC